ncbi:MAG TPA: SEL1-like repeat protein [Bacteroidia bacterium]|nr:SEL1-like repeat protein [Bacteroidia bacterium]
MSCLSNSGRRRSSAIYSLDTEKNLDKARELYQKAASLGDTDAKTHLAELP